MNDRVRKFRWKRYFLFSSIYAIGISCTGYFVYIFYSIITQGKIVLYERIIPMMAYVELAMCLIAVIGLSLFWLNFCIEEIKRVI